jgi:HNH endonuclease
MTYLACFRMPTPVRITGRTSTITNSFVNGVIPCIQPTEEELAEALRILAIQPNDLRCAYCGDPSTEWDHLRPIVAKQRPTGYISEIANLVPACGKCNQSKSGAPWRLWISGPARFSPATRGVPDLDERIARLEKYEQWRQPTLFDFAEAAGPELWEQHWANWERMIAFMKEAEEIATMIRHRIASRADA